MNIYRHTSAAEVSACVCKLPLRLGKKKENCVLVCTKVNKQNSI